jgi:hypothetical protein
MDHLSGSILTGGWPDLQESPIVLQFGAVNLRPSLDEALLQPGQTSGQALERVNGDDSRVILVERVKV